MPLPISQTTGKNCGEPLKIKHGRVDSNLTRNGTLTVHYSCNKGFALIGRTNLTCLSSGKWEKAKIKCGEFCTNPLDHSLDLLSLSVLKSV